MSDSPSPGDPRAPVAARRPHRLEAHGDVRVDDWWWLRDRDDPEVIAYLEAENAYGDAALAGSAELRRRLYEQIKGRVQEDDVSAPGRRGGWWYWTRTTEGEQYGTHCRLADPDRRLDAAGALDAARGGQGEVVLDENALAAGQDFFDLGVLDVSPDDEKLAYAADYDGSERYTLRFRALASGTDLDDVVAGVTYTSAWSADSSALFYVRPDDAMRPYQVWRHRLGTPAADDVCVFHETDERYFLSVELSRSRRFVLIHSSSKQTSETRWIDAAEPDTEAAVVLPRVQGVEYDVDHAVLPGRGDAWLLRINDAAPNFELRLLPVGADIAEAETLVAHREDVTISSADAFAGHVVVSERAEGLERLRILGLADGDDHLVDQPEPVYAVTRGHERRVRLHHAPLRLHLAGISHVDGRGRHDQPSANGGESATRPGRLRRG